MFSKNRNKAQSRIDTLIGVETRVEGNVHFVGGLRVDGEIRGNVSEAADNPPIGEQVAEQNQTCRQQQAPVPWAPRTYGYIARRGSEMTFDAAPDTSHEAAFIVTAAMARSPARFVRPGRT